MAYDKIVDSAKLDGAMAATADAIRGKTGKTADIPWNESTGFASEIASITTETEPNLQAKTATPSTSAQTIKPDSGYDGLSQVTVNAMPTATQATPTISVSSAGLITAAATQAAGYVAAGTKSATKQLSTQAAKTVTPGTSNQTAVASGKYTTGAVTVKGDANLKAENIAKGVSIFGVAGTFAGGTQIATGSFEITGWSRTFAGYPYTITGLPFKPTRVIIYYTGLKNANGGYPNVGIYMIDSNGGGWGALGIHNDIYYDEELDEDVDDYIWWHYSVDNTADGSSDNIHFLLNDDGFSVTADQNYHPEVDDMHFREGVYNYIALG